MGGDPGCTSDCPDGKCPECEPALLLRYQQGRYCGIIADKSGPFRWVLLVFLHCHGVHGQKSSSNNLKEKNINCDLIKKIYPLFF